MKQWTTTRTIRMIAALFAVSLMLTACEPEELLQLLGQTPVEQADAAAPDDTAEDTPAESDDDAAADKAPARDRKKQDRQADNGNGGTDRNDGPAGGDSAAGLSAIENEIFTLLNSTRRDAGLRALALNAEMSAGARDWSCDMAASGNFRHADLRSAGVNGENIAWGQRSAAQVHQGWMESPGHRDNRMSSRWTQYGVGVCEDGDGRLYYTERFR